MTNNKKIFFYFLTFLLFFIIFEVTLNILKIRPNNSNYGWLNAHDTYNNLVEEITVNEFGTRDTKIKNIKKKNIILLGDSQVELAQKKTKMPARILEKHLKQNYNVYSLGSWGWGTDQQLLILINSIKKIKPKYVIVFFTPNDLTDNYHNIGFKGEKPTFKINKEGQLIKPTNTYFKKLLNYSWTYRFFYRLKIFYKNRNQKNFLTEESFKKRNECSNDNIFDLKKLIVNKVDYEWYMQKYITQSKNNKNISSQKELIEKNYYKFFDKRNNYELETDRGYDYFRDIRTDIENEKILLTNKLLREIQKESNNNNAEMYLVNIINFNYLFKENIEYKICINNKEVIYSNQNYYKTFKDIFEGINNIINFSIERGTIDYDPNDGHLNFEMNNKLFKKVSEYLQK
tara:strand:- start:1396 stop:2598 length:1203 start_codon:yes stop_codon:yes gene_type:complete